MVYVNNPKCNTIDCNARASIGISESSQIMCKKHKLENMI